MPTRSLAIALKEIRVLLRSRRAFWMLLLALIIIGGGFALTWLDSGGNTSVANRARFSCETFIILSVTLICTMGLITPILTAVSVTGEREHKTLDLLYCTSVPRSSLFLGKWLAAISFQILLVICLLPILSLIFQLGGVGTDEYLFSAAIAALTVATYGMLGLAISVRARRSVKAMMVALGIVLFLNIGVYMLMACLAIFHFVNNDIVLIRIITTTCPPALFGFLSEQIITRGIRVRGLNSGDMIFYHVLFQGTIFLLSAWIAWRGLARGETLKPTIAKKTIDDPTLLARRRRRFPYYLIDPLRRAQVIGDRRNPFFIKEHRYSAVCGPRSTIRLGYLGLLISVPLLGAVFNDYQANGVMSTLAVWGISLTALVAPILSAIGITGEREEGTLDLLLTTPEAPPRIVSAKFLAVLRTLGFLVASVICIPVVTQFCVGRESQASLIALAKIVPFSLAFLSLYAALGVCISALCRRNLTAISTTYVLMLALYLLPVLAPELGRNIREAVDFLWPLGPLLLYVFPLISPVYPMDHNIKNYNPHFIDSSRNVGHYDEHWAPILIRAALIGLMAWGLLRVARRRLVEKK